MRNLKRSDFIVRSHRSQSRLDKGLTFAQIHEDLPEQRRIKVAFLFPAKRNEQGEILYNSIERETHFASVCDWRNFGTDLTAAEKFWESVYGT